MRFIALGSSSSGNAYIVDDGTTTLLIECGLTYRRLGILVRKAGYTVSGLSGCLISHEHKDHSKCWDRLVAAGVPVYASHGTISALGAEESIKPISYESPGNFGVPETIGSYDVIPYRTFHDAVQPQGFLIHSKADGEWLAFATDTCNIRYRFEGLNLLAIEANYEERILARNTRIPESRRERIQNTHMEIGRLCGYLSTLDLSQCRTVYLLHLSDASSDEAWFEECVRRVVPAGCRVVVCEKGG